MSPCDALIHFCTTACSSRIQMSKTGAVIFQLLLKQQKTSPLSGRPQSARRGAGATARDPSLA
jgi:hypothetical protein